MRVVHGLGVARQNDLVFKPLYLRYNLIMPPFVINTVGQHRRGSRVLEPDLPGFLNAQVSQYFDDDTSTIKSQRLGTLMVASPLEPGDEYTAGGVTWLVVTQESRNGGLYTYNVREQG